MIINWDEYFMALSKVSALRSKDPNTQVGATLVNGNKRVIALGYNGMPGGDDTFPWSREGETEDTKYPYVVHAEVNAILNAIESPRGSTLYVSLFPCSNCAKMLSQAGVREIVYESDIYEGTPDNLISKRIFKQLNIKTRKINPVNISVSRE